jgi:hypothetical protein
MFHRFPAHPDKLLLLSPEQIIFLATLDRFGEKIEKFTNEFFQRL